jgi:hypothetical protein
VNEIIVGAVYAAIILSLVTADIGFNSMIRPPWLDAVELPVRAGLLRGQHLSWPGTSWVWAPHRRGRPVQPGWALGVFTDLVE